MRTSVKYNGECQRIRTEGVRENLSVLEILYVIVLHLYEIGGVCRKHKIRVSEANDGKCRMRASVKYTGDCRRTRMEGVRENLSV